MRKNEFGVFQEHQGRRPRGVGWASVRVYSLMRELGFILSVIGL